MKIRALTLNCFGVKSRRTQFGRIAAAVAEEEVDVCFFQEVIFTGQAKLLANVLHEAGYCTHWLKPKGWPGLVAGGLLIVVRDSYQCHQPIFTPFTRQLLAAQPLTWTDALLRKGVLRVPFELGNGRCVQLICAHTVGAYNQGLPLQQLLADQLRELAEKSGDGPALIGADLNLTPDQISLPGFVDALAGQVGAITVDNQKNPLRQSTLARLAGRGSKRPDKRIDYLLGRKVVFSEGRICFDTVVPPLSDHHGIFAEVVI